MSTSIDLDQHTRPHWTDTERANVELVAEFVRLIMNEHDYTTARERFGDHPYVQHSRGIPDGIDNLFVYLEGITKRFPGYSYDVKRITVDDDQVTFRAHATMRNAHRGDERKGLNIIDTWRIENGQITDHWDAVQPLGFDMRLFSLLRGGATRHHNGLF